MRTARTEAAFVKLWGLDGCTLNTQSVYECTQCSLGGKGTIWLCAACIRWHILCVYNGNHGGYFHLGLCSKYALCVTCCEREFLDMLIANAMSKD